MDTVVTVEAAKTDLSQLLGRAHAGEEIIIAKAGEPYARSVPLDCVKRRPLGLAAASVDAAFFDPLPDDELATWG